MRIFVFDTCTIAAEMRAWAAGSTILLDGGGVGGGGLDPVDVTVDVGRPTASSSSSSSSAVGDDDGSAEAMVMRHNVKIFFDAAVKEQGRRAMLLAERLVDRFGCEITHPVVFNVSTTKEILSREVVCADDGETTTTVTVEQTRTRSVPVPGVIVLSTQRRTHRDR
jgi:hypothetical protein